MCVQSNTSDPDLPPANSQTDPPASQRNDRIWGYEKPAVVEEHVFNNWKLFPNCDQSTYYYCQWGVCVWMDGWM